MTQRQKLRERLQTVSPTVAISQLPRTWRIAIKQQRQRGAEIGAMARLDVPLGCMLALLFGIVAVPLMIMTIVDLLAHG